METDPGRASPGATVACRACGEPNSHRALFCQRCGRSLSPVAREPVVRAPSGPTTHAATVVACEVLAPEGRGSAASATGREERSRRALEKVVAVLQRGGGAAELVPQRPHRVIAAFGVHPSHGDGSQRAARAVQEIRAAIDALNARLQGEGAGGVRLRAGLASGEVVIGDPTASPRTASGPGVELAERVMRAAAAGDVLVATEAVQALGDAVEVEPWEPGARTPASEEPATTATATEPEPEPDPDPEAGAGASEDEDERSEEEEDDHPRDYFEEIDPDDQIALLERSAQFRWPEEEDEDQDEDAKEADDGDDAGPEEGDEAHDGVPEEEPVADASASGDPEPPDETTPREPPADAAADDVDDGGADEDFDDVGEAIEAVRLLRVEPEDGVRTPPDPPMLGRDDELAKLRMFHDRVVADRACRLITITGESGVGKTRLVDEFLEGLGPQVALARTRCTATMSAVSAGALADLVEQAAGIARGDSAAHAKDKIARLLAEEEDGSTIAARVGYLLALRGGRPAPGEAPWAVRRTLETLARRRPLVLLVDGVDRAPDTFVHLLRSLLERSDGVPLSIVCTARRDVIGEDEEWTTAERPSSIHLERPSDEGFAEHVGHLLGRSSSGEGIGDTSHDDEVAPVIVRASGRSPFVAEQMVSMLVEEGLLREEDGRWVSNGDLTELPSPPSVDALIDARLQELAPPERDLIRRAAFIGEDFPWAALAAVVPDEDRLVAGDRLDGLVRKRLLRPRSTEPGEDVYAFRHPMIRKAALRGVAPEIEADVHDRFAPWLEAAAGDRSARHDELLGSHLEGSVRCRARSGMTAEAADELARRASDLLASAGARAEGAGDAPAAFALFERAAALLAPLAPARPGLLLRASIALMEGGEGSRAEPLLNEAARSAATIGDRSSEWRAKVLRAGLQTRAWSEQGGLERARQTAERAVEVFMEIGDHWGLASAWTLSGYVHACRGHYAAAAEDNGRAVQHARRAERPIEELAAVRALAEDVLEGPAPIAHATQRLMELVKRTRAGRLAEQDVVGVLAVLDAQRGRFDQARALDARATAVVEELGLDSETVTRIYRSSMIELYAGDVDAAEAKLRRALDAAVRAGDESARARVGALLAHIVARRERYGDALRLTEEAERGAAASDVPAKVSWRTARARILAEGGRLEEADALARRAVRLADQTDGSMLRATARVRLAEILRIEGRSNEAIPFVNRALRAFRRRGADGLAATAQELLEELGTRADASEPADTAGATGATPEEAPGEAAAPVEVAGNGHGRSTSPEELRADPATAEPGAEDGAAEATVPEGPEEAPGGAGEPPAPEEEDEPVPAPPAEDGYFAATAVPSEGSSTPEPAEAGAAEGTPKATDPGRQKKSFRFW